MIRLLILFLFISCTNHSSEQDICDAMPEKDSSDRERKALCFIGLHVKKIENER